MPFSSPDSRLRALERDLEGLGKPDGFGQRMILSGIKRAVMRGPLRDEFRTGVGPDGPWKKTARGKQPLDSRKLAGAFTASVTEGAVEFEGAVARDWLSAHQIGGTFSARHVAAQKHFLTFNRHGRLIKNSRALNKKGQVKRGIYQVFARAHKIGRRVLPARPMVPTGSTLPPSWDAAVTAGAEDGLTRWMKKVAQ